jgi:hypothetical protein
VRHAVARRNRVEGRTVGVNFSDSGAEKSPKEPRNLRLPNSPPF